MGIGYYKPDPWDSHSKQVSRQPQKASMLNQLTDLLLECSDCESLHNGPGWLRFALNKCAKCNLGPSLGVRLKTSLDPANAGSRQTSRPAGKQTSRQARKQAGIASTYIYIYILLCCAVLCCAVLCIWGAMKNKTSPALACFSGDSGSFCLICFLRDGARERTLDLWIEEVGAGDGGAVLALGRAQLASPTQDTHFPQDCQIPLR